MEVLVDCRWQSQIFFLHPFAVLTIFSARAIAFFVLRTIEGDMSVKPQQGLLDPLLARHFASFLCFFLAKHKKR
jgi:hypothetical protein